MLKHPWQLALALLGIGIGVAVIVAVDLANGSARKAFLLSMDTVTGEATHQVVGGPLGVDESVYATLRVEHIRTEIDWNDVGLISYLGELGFEPAQCVALSRNLAD